jgi:hypothetical protein
MGDHIKVSRGIYDHHGIFAGNQNVIHYYKTNDVSKIALTSFENFSENSGTEIVIHNTPKYSPDEVILRARSRIDEGQYHFLFHNCEHFCNWCIDGISRSDQVNRAFIALELAFAAYNPTGAIIALALKLAIEIGVEKPYRELLQNTKNLASATAELEKVSKIVSLSQKIFSGFLEKDIQLETKLKNQFDRIDVAGANALGIINKI